MVARLSIMMPAAMVVSIQPIAFGSLLNGRTSSRSIRAPTTAAAAMATGAATSSGKPRSTSTTVTTAPNM